MIRIQILIFTLFLTHYTQASQTDFKERLQQAITQHSKEENRDVREQIAAVLNFLRNQPEQRVPDPLLPRLTALKLASEEGAIYPEVLALTPKIEHWEFGSPPLYCVYYLTN